MPFWPAEQIVDRGYVAAAFHNADVDPDKYDEFKNGVHGLFDRPGKRPDDAWATIAAWAWGASRAMDYFETDDAIDEKHIAVIGHSRGGKTSLWAGAEDQRFAMGRSPTTPVVAAPRLSTTLLWRNRRTDQPVLSPLVLCELRQV